MTPSAGGLFCRIKRPCLRSWGSRATGRVALPSAGTVNPVEQGIDTEIPAHIPRRASNAVAPILTPIAGCMAGLYLSGEGDSLREAHIATGSSWGVMAILLTWALRLLGRKAATR